MTTIQPHDYLQVRQTSDRIFSRHILSPKNVHLRRWHCVVAFTVVVTCILETFMAAFDSTVSFLWGIAYTCDVIFCTDIVLTFFTAHPDKKGVLQNNRREIAKAYLRTNFFADLLSVLPTDILALGINWISVSKLLTLLRINRLIRFYHVLCFFGKREQEIGTNTGVLRCLKYGVVSLVTTHWVTSAWYALGCGGNHSGIEVKECYADSWADNIYFDVGFDLQNASAIDSYVVSLYWAVATATSTGYGDIHSVNIKEKWFSILAMLVGIAVFFGMLLGGMTSMLTNFDRKRATYVHRISNIKEHLKEHSIPEDLTEQAMGYYKYLWIRKKGVLDSGMFKHLPLTMQADVTFTTCKSILEKALIFEGLGKGFLRMLSLKLRPEMYLPNQMIVHRGDIGSQMFYIHKGEVEVLAPNSNEPVATLGSGKLFGAVSLVYNIPRSASVRAKTHCDLMVLDRHELANLLTHYPEVSLQLQKQTGDRCSQAKAISDQERLTVYTGIAQKRRRLSINSPWKRVQALSVQKRFSSGLNESASGTDETGAGGADKASNLYSVAMDLKRKHKIGAVESNCNDDSDDDDDPETCVERAYSWCHEKATNNWKWLSSAVIKPRGRFSRVWQGVIIMTVLLISIIHPYMACFGAHEYREGYFESGFGVTILSFTYILDAVLFMDIIIHLRTEIYTPHGILSDFKDILHAYAASWLLCFDIAAVAPTEIFALIYPSGSERNRVAVLLRLNRIIKVLKMTSLFHQVEQTLKVSIRYVRTVKVMLYIAALSHWTACIFYAAACYGVSCRDTSWLVQWAAGREAVMDPGETTVAPITALSGYLAATYWAVATMTSTGYGDISANTGLGRILALSAMVIGLLLYGYVLSSMAATLANLDRPRVQFQEKLIAVKSFMKERKLNKNLQDRVIQYLALLWQKHKGIWMPGQLPMLWDMPVGLQEDIGVADCASILAKVPLFRDTGDSFLRTLGLMSTQYIYSPGDIVVYSGEIGREMFVIRRGMCEVLTPDMQTVLLEVGPGQHFGELGMLFGNHRSANVRAKTYCEILELKMSDVTNALKKYPLLEADFHMNIQDRTLFQELQQLAGTAKPWPTGHSVQHLNYRIVPHTEGTDDRTKNRAPLAIRRHSVDPPEPSPSPDNLTSFKRKNSEYAEFINQQHPAVKLLSKLLMKRTFTPEGRLVKGWTFLMVVVSMILALTIPTQAAFLHYSLIMWVFHYCVDILLYIRLYLRMHVGYFNDSRVLVTHPICTAKQYLKTNFVIDLLTCFPVELIGFFCHPDFSSPSLHLFAMLRLNRLLSLYQVPKAFSYLESSVEKETGRVREIKFIFYCAIFVNWATCVVFMAACPPDVLGTMGNYMLPAAGGHNCIAGSWITNSHYNISLSNMGTLYTISLYWSTATALSVGYGEISANTDFEMVVSLIIMILGILFFGYIIASIAASRANDDAQRARFQEKLIAIRRYMTDQKLSVSLQRRVIDHYYHVWIRTKGIDPEGLFHGIPGAVWGDVAFSLYQEIISKISIFEGTEVSFHKLLSKCIKPMFFLKDEYIVRKYDIGHEMYFIHHGAVDVISEHDEEVFATLRAGTGFGEVALLFSCPRTATIRAKCNTDVFVLTKQELDLALECYPDVRDQMMVIAKERRHQARVRSADRSIIQAQLSRHAEAMRQASQEEEHRAESEDDSEEDVIDVIDYQEDSKYSREDSEGEAIVAKQPEPGSSSGGGGSGTSKLEKPTRSSTSSSMHPSRSTSGDKMTDASSSSRDRRRSSVRVRIASGDQGVPPDNSKPPTLTERIKKLNTFTVPPRRKAVIYFRLMMCVMSVFSVWLITYQMAYQNHSIVIMAINYGCDLFYLCDIYLKFHMSFYNEHGDLVEEYHVVAENYRDRLIGFPVDCVAAFPLEIFALLAQPGKKLTMMSYLRLIHVIRFFNVYNYFNDLEKELDVNMLIVRLWKNIVNLGMMMHLFSCVWYMVACPLDQCKSGTWVEAADIADKLDAYCTSIYWCVATMTSTGYGDVRAHTAIEMLFATVVMIAGKLMFGFVLGNIAFTLANDESLRVNFDQNLDSIKSTMEDQQVPKSLQRRVVSYFDYIWVRERGQDIKELMKDCPECMLSDICLEVSRPMLEALSLLTDSEESFLRQLALQVNQVLFMPGDYVTREGDIGNEVLYIKRGQVERLRSDTRNAEVVDTYGPGTVIGEVNLVCSIPQQITMRAKSHLDLLKLSKENLESVLRYFPLIGEQIKVAAQERYGHVIEAVQSLERASAVI